MEAELTDAADPLSEAAQLLQELGLGALAGELSQAVPAAKEGAKDASVDASAWLSGRSQLAGAAGDAEQLERALTADVERLRRVRALLQTALARAAAAVPQQRHALDQALAAHHTAAAALDQRLARLEAQLALRGAQAAAAASLHAADSALAKAHEARALLAAFAALASGRSWPPPGPWAPHAPVLRRLAVLTHGAGGTRAAAVRARLPALRDAAEAALQQALHEAAAARDPPALRSAYAAVRALVGAEAAWRPHVTRVAGVQQGLLPARLKDPAAAACRVLAARVADDQCAAAASAADNAGRPLAAALDEVARDLARDVRLLEPLAEDRAAAAQFLLSSVAASTGAALLQALRSEAGRQPLVWLHALPLAFSLLADWLMLLLPLAGSAASASALSGATFEAVLEPLFVDERARFLPAELQWFADFAGACLASEPLADSNSAKGDRPRWWTLGTGSAKTPLTGTLSVETALTLLHASEAAQARGRLFASPLQQASHAHALFSALLQQLGLRYVAGHVERASRRLTAEQQQLQKTATPTTTVLPAVLDALSVVQAANHIILMLEKHYNQTVAPLVQQSVNEETNCQMGKTALVLSLEERIIATLEGILTIAGAHMDKLLSTHQKKGDWRVKPEEEEALEMMEARPSRACLACVDFVKDLHRTIVASLDGTNLTAFLQQLGNRLHRVLLVHIRQYQISVGIGGMKLLRDITTFKELIAAWNLPEINKLFSQLHELAKVFLLPPANLRHLFQQSELSSFSQAEIQTFVKLRTDYSSSWVGKYL